MNSAATSLQLMTMVILDHNRDYLGETKIKQQFCPDNKAGHLHLKSTKEKQKQQLTCVRSTILASAKTKTTITLCQRK